MAQVRFFNVHLNQYGSITNWDSSGQILAAIWALGIFCCITSSPLSSRKVTLVDQLHASAHISYRLALKLKQVSPWCEKLFNKTT